MLFRLRLEFKVLEWLLGKIESNIFFNMMLVG